MATFEIIITFFPPKLVIIKKNKFIACVVRGFMHCVLWLAFVFAHLLIGFCFVLLLINTSPCSCVHVFLLMIGTSFGSCVLTCQCFFIDPWPFLLLYADVRELEVFSSFNSNF